METSPEWNDIKLLLIGTLHRHYLKGPSNKIFVRIWFVVNSYCIVLIEWAFDYFVVSKSINTVLGDVNTEQYLFYELYFIFCNTCSLFFNVKTWLWTKVMSTTLFWFLYCWLWTYLTSILVFLLTFSRKLPAGISVFKTALRKLQTKLKTK